MGDFWFFDWAKSIAKTPSGTSVYTTATTKAGTPATPASPATASPVSPATSSRQVSPPSSHPTEHPGADEVAVAYGDRYVPGLEDLIVVKPNGAWNTSQADLAVAEMKQRREDTMPMEYTHLVAEGVPAGEAHEAYARGVPANEVREGWEDRRDDEGGGDDGLGPLQEYPIEETAGFGFYEFMHEKADWWNENAVPFAEKYIGYHPLVAGLNLQNTIAGATQPILAPIFGSDRVTQAGQQRQAALDIVTRLPVGLVSSVGTTVDMVGMIPSGAQALIETGTRHPETILPIAAAGLGMQATGLIEGFRTDPGKMAGELVGFALLTHGTGKVLSRSPFRPGFDTAIFPEARYSGVGFRTSWKTMDTFRPVISFTRKPGQLIGRPSLGTPRATLDILGREQYIPKTAFETAIIRRAVGIEGKKISLGLNVRQATRNISLKLREAKPTVREVLTEHGIRDPAVANAVIRTLKIHGADLYGSVIQRGIGIERRMPGLSRIARDFDVVASDMPGLSRDMAANMNAAAGRDIVSLKNNQITVKATGEKLFDIHARETPGLYRQPLPDEYIAYGLRADKVVKTTEGINTITLREQMTRKLAGSMEITAEMRSLIAEGSGAKVTGRIAPTHAGRIKDIGDFYYGEKVNIAALESSLNPLNRNRAVIADLNLEAWLQTWGSKVAGDIRARYAADMKTIGIRVQYDLIGKMDAQPDTFIPSNLIPAARFTSPDFPSLTRSPSPGPSRLTTLSPSLGLIPSSFSSPGLGVRPSPGISPSPTPTKSLSSPGITVQTSQISPPPTPASSTITPTTGRGGGSGGGGRRQLITGHFKQFDTFKTSLTHPQTFTMTIPKERTTTYDLDRDFPKFRMNFRTEALGWHILNEVPNLEKMFGTGRRANYNPTVNLNIKTPKLPKVKI